MEFHYQTDYKNGVSNYGEISKENLRLLKFRTD